MKKWLDVIWGDFDKEDPTEWFVLGLAWTLLVLFLLVGNL